jgi:hypothetical protein
MLGWERTVSQECTSLMLDKPSIDTMLQTARRTSKAAGAHGLKGFYISEPLQAMLKSTFPASYRLRTRYRMGWDQADAVANDPEMLRDALEQGQIPEIADYVVEKDDPVANGQEQNIPLCAFWWLIRRFLDASKYCLVCCGRAY